MSDHPPTCETCGQRIRPPVTRRPEASIEDAIMAEVRARANGDFVRLMETLVLHPEKRISTGKRLAHELAIHTMTLQSKTQRLGLPSPHEWVVWVRALRAARLFEDASRTVASVAYAMNFNSPQAFGRSLKTYFGMTAVAFRTGYTSQTLLQRFVNEMLEPHRAALAQFSLTPRPLWQSRADRIRLEKGA